MRRTWGRQRIENHLRICLIPYHPPAQPPTPPSRNRFPLLSATSSRPASATKRFHSPLAVCLLPRRRQIHLNVHIYTRARILTHLTMHSRERTTMQKGTATVLQICNTPTPSERTAGKLGCYLSGPLVRTATTAAAVVDTAFPPPSLLTKPTSWSITSAACTRHNRQMFTIGISMSFENTSPPFSRHMAGNP